MPLDFSALTTEITRLEGLVPSVEAAIKTPVSNPADQATLDALTAREKAANDALTASLPPTS
jgi:hypothetical protein